TLMLTAFNVNGFRSPSTHYFSQNNITATVNLSDGATNTGVVNLSENTFNGDVTYANNSAATARESTGGSNIYNGNLTLVRNAGGIAVAYNTPTYINGNLILNSATGINFTDTVKFGGGTATVIEQLGTQAIVMPKLQMAKTGTGSLSLNDSLTISDKLNFGGGLIIGSGSNFLKFLNGSVYADTTKFSHVKGPVRKVGNSIFTFPIGTDTSLNLVAMSAPGLATDVFSAEYKLKNPSLDGFDTSLRGAPLLRISGCEYWVVQRITGSSNVFLTFSFMPPCALNHWYISDPSYVRIARWTGGGTPVWENLGNSASTGTINGTITTGAAVTNFSPFTFASIDLSINLLPLTLKYFIAEKMTGKVKLQWRTDNEINTSKFEVERSTDGRNFASVYSTPAFSTQGEHDYLAYDASPAPGLNYYRLKMIDRDGKYTLSYIVRIDFSKTYDISVIPNPAKDYFILTGSGDFEKVEIIDIRGKMVRQYNRSISRWYSLSGISSGIYFIRLAGAKEKITTKLIIE
ncbi:MAG TPA: T9SS type A sorting domain-containing protein, partial [Ferruginibacter sp.]|nr:T9SS type A sorting domain-containing protein [Ferruginibacter sp.]